jgi:RNA polymerase sigma-70 factor (ECF subfamily)
VLIYLARRCLDPEVAVDLMAETFAEAFANRHTRRGGSDEEARAWVFGIARNLLANYFRRGQIERRALRRLGLQTPAVSSEVARRLAVSEDAARARVSRGLRQLVAALSNPAPGGAEIHE